MFDEIGQNCLCKIGQCHQLQQGFAPGLPSPYFYHHQIYFCLVFQDDRLLPKIVAGQYNYCCYKSKFHLARHETTRSLAFWHREKSCRAVSRLLGQHGATRSSQQARLTRHMFTGVATAWLEWTCPPHFFQKLFLRLMQIQSTKD